MKSLIILTLAFISLQSVSFGADKNELLLQALSNTLTVGSGEIGCGIKFQKADADFDGAIITINSTKKIFSENRFGNHDFNKAIIKISGDPVITETRSTENHFYEAEFRIVTPAIADDTDRRNNDQFLDNLIVTFDEQANIVNITGLAHNPYLNGDTTQIKRLRCN
jgi:hypothetical protein